MAEMEGAGTRTATGVEKEGLLLLVAVENHRELSESGRKDVREEVK